MPIKKADFHSIFIDEGDPFYDNIYQLNKDNFNNWVSINFKKKGVVNSFDEVIPSEETLYKMIRKGYKHKPSQCHYSSKAICLLDENFEYWTGFVHNKDLFLPIITHSFNVLNETIVDFSRIDKNYKPINSDFSYFPNEYYGIRIPIEFVKKFKNETFDEYSMKPLLFEWYQENKSN